MAGWWDETGPGGHPCQIIAPHDIPDVPPDWAAWSARLAADDDPPPKWMRPQGRRSAESAARMVRRVAQVAVLLAVAVGVLLWSLRAGG